MITFTCIEKKLTNINTGNVYIDSQIAGSNNVIGEKKKFEFTYETDVYSSIAGYNLFINFAMFAEKGSINPLVKKGVIYWECRLPDIITPQTIECGFNSNGTTGFKETYRNYQVQVEIIDAQTFKVILYFYQSFDALGYMVPSSGLNNKDRFKKDRYNNLEDFIVTGRSIYNGSTHEGRTYIFAEKNDDVNNFGSIEEEWAGYTAKFYGGYPGTYGNAPSVAFKYFVGAVEVDAINSYLATTVQVTINSPDYAPTLVAAVMKVNTSDNTLDFIENYAFESTLVSAIAPPSTIITTPYSAPAYVSPGVYVASFSIDPAEVSITEIYQFMAFVYDPSGELPSVFASSAPGTGVNQNKPYMGGGFDTIGSLTDYEKEYFGEFLTTVIEERLRSKVLFSFAANQYKNEIFQRLGLVINNDITTFLTRINFRIYELSTVNIPFPSNCKHILDERSVAKKTLVQNLPGAAFSVSFPSADTMRLSADWRNRYEVLVPNIRTEVDAIPGLNIPFSNQYWGGRNLFIEWELIFLYDQLSNPFTDIVRYTQKFNVSDYDSTNLEILTQDPDQETKQFFCKTEEIKLKALLGFTPAPGEDYKLINNIEPTPGSILTIEEKDPYTDIYLTQLTSNKIMNQETLYGTTIAQTAKFELNGTNLNETDYKVSALAKQVK